MKNHKRVKKQVAVFLHLSPEEGGKFQYSLSILKALEDQDKFKVSAYYTNALWEEYIPASFVKSTLVKIRLFSQIVRKLIPFVPILLPLWRRAARYMDPIHKIILGDNPDMIIYPHNNSFAYEIPLPAMIPVFDLMHRYEKNFPELTQRSGYRIREYHYKMIGKYSKAVLVDSKVGLEHTIDSYGMNQGKVYILPYTSPSYIYDTVDSNQVLDKYNLPERFIFYPAQLWQHKNHLALIEAIDIMQEEGHTVNAVFVGAGKNNHKTILSKISELNLENQIYLIDYVSNAEIIGLYKKAEALVMPTFLGPTNIPPLEAFALGCPVIVSNVYGMPDQVKDAALLIDPNDVQDIAKKIQMLYTDSKLKETLIENGFKRAKALGHDVFKKNFLKILDTTLTKLSR
jgi:glycosyltransferase involved in cell wall biosynthesis